jgi:hypothetical protein
VQATSGSNGTFALRLPTEWLDERPMVDLRVDADGKLVLVHTRIGQGNTLLRIDLVDGFRAMPRDPDRTPDAATRVFRAF